MKLCKTCKFWSNEWDGGECNKIDCDKTDKINIRVQVDDDSGLYVKIKTKENFGCVLHEEK